MSFPDYKYGTGLGNVGSYQVSGKPFLTSSEVPASGAQPNFFKISFPAVTKEIMLYNNGATSEDVRVAFSSNGLMDNVKNYFLLHPGTDGGVVERFDVKATELYLMCDTNQTPLVSVYASLTGIGVDRIDNISPMIVKVIRTSNILCFIP